MSIPRIESEAQIIDGKVVIALKIESLAEMARNSEYFFGCAEAGNPIKVTDAAELAESVVRGMNLEAEDGSTPVFRLLEEAIEWVSEQGEPGIDDA